MSPKQTQFNEQNACAVIGCENPRKRARNGQSIYAYCEVHYAKSNSKNQKRYRMKKKIAEVFSR